MTNSIKRFISLALFAQFLIVLTLQQKPSRRGYKKTFLSNNQELLDISKQDLGAKPDHHTKLNSIKPSRYSNFRSDPDEEVEDIPYTWAPGVYWHEDICHENFDLAIVMQATNDPLEENKEEDWITTYKPFLIKLVNTFSISEDKVRAAIVLFGTNPMELVSFKHKRSQNKEQILQRIEEITKTDLENTKNAYYVDALQYTMDNVIFKHGTREDAAKVVVSFFYGPENDRNEEFLLNVVDDYKRKVVKIISVGMDMENSKNIYILGRCKHDDRRCPTAILLYHDDLLKGPYGVQRRLCDDGLGYYEPGSENSKKLNYIK